MSGFTPPQLFTVPAGLSALRASAHVPRSPRRRVGMSLREVRTTLMTMAALAMSGAVRSLGSAQPEPFEDGSRRPARNGQYPMCRSPS
jgi:hypothetical protein